MKMRKLIVTVLAAFSLFALAPSLSVAGPLRIEDSCACGGDPSIYYVMGCWPHHGHTDCVFLNGYGETYISHFYG